MHIRSDVKTGTVLIRLTAREAMALADKLTRAAIQSGGSVEDGDRQEPGEEKVEEWEP
jgi:hypothetical protein